MLVQTPGIKVVIPSNPYDAKGLLISAIRDNDPVFFMEHLNLYHAYREEVPEEDYTVPLGEAKIVREGKDVTIIAYGLMVHTAMKAAAELEKEGIQAEVIDCARWFFGYRYNRRFDQEDDRAIIVQEAQKTSGVAAEFIAQINEKAILHLEAPVLRVTGPDTVYPFAQIEDTWLPTPARIVSWRQKKVLDF